MLGFLAGAAAIVDPARALPVVVPIAVLRALLRLRTRRCRKAKASKAAAADAEDATPTTALGKTEHPEYSAVVPKADLTWCNVSCTLKTHGGQDKCILAGVSGSAHAGRRVKVGLRHWRPPASRQLPCCSQAA